MKNLIIAAATVLVTFASGQAFDFDPNESLDQQVVDDGTVPTSSGNKAVAADPSTSISLTGTEVFRSDATVIR